MASTAKKLAPAAPAKPTLSTTPAPKPSAKKSAPKLMVVTNKVATPKTDPKMYAASAALDNSRSATFVCDLDWNVQYTNKRSNELLAFMEPNLHAFHPSWRTFIASNVIGSNLSFLFHDEPVEYRQFTDSRNHPYKTRIKTGPCVCDLQVTSIKDANDNTTGYAVDWDRITDKLAQEKRVSQLLAVLENAATNTFLCDLSWNIIYANRRSFEVLEFMEPNLHKFDSRWSSFSAKDILNNSIQWLFTDEPGELTKAAHVAAHPYHKIVKTGPCFCEVSITGTYDEDNALNGYAVTWERITERVATEMRNSQLLAALEASSTNIMLTDTERKVLYTNQALQKNLKVWESELQKAFGAGFKNDQLLERCIEGFHKNPQHQRIILGSESNFPINALIEVGEMKIELAINGLKNAEGTLLGFTTEWTDATQRIAATEKYKAEVKTIADRMDFLRGACSTDLANAMQALAEGNLTVTLVPKTPLLEIPEEPDLAVMANTFNELRNQTVKAVEAYNNAQQSLSGLIADTLQAADSIAKSSNEVTIGNDDLAQRTEEQASSLEETASSMEEMTSTVKQNADNAKQANQLALQAREAAEKGGIVVGNAVSTMSEINVASKRIADIISVIDEIAFQTNLLALNAAVEAARVGEQGRGFAVVAGEVRNLAGRSATAAKEIKSLVQDSVQKVQEGSSLVNQSGQQLEEIVNSVKKVADIISEISAAAQEQSEGIEQVNKAIIQMDQITQQNAALVEEASATSQSMNQQAEGLQELVSKFQVDASFTTKVVSAPAPAARASFSKRPSARVASPAATSRVVARPSKKATSDEFEEF